jgi:mRNA interferase YafQ
VFINTLVLKRYFKIIIMRLLSENFGAAILLSNWHDHRDCHINQDLILIYKKPDDATLQLLRLGSHSELSL